MSARPDVFWALFLIIPNENTRGTGRSVRRHDEVDPTGVHALLSGGASDTIASRHRHGRSQHGRRKRIRPQCAGFRSEIASFNRHQCLRCGPEQVTGDVHDPRDGRLESGNRCQLADAVAIGVRHILASVGIHCQTARIDLQRAGGGSSVAVGCRPFEGQSGLRRRCRLSGSGGSTGRRYTYCRQRPR